MSTNYKADILEYLKKRSGKEVPRQLLCEKFGVSKSRLSEVLSSIKNDGYTLTSTARSGKVKLEYNQDQLILPDIKDSDIRKWLIIYVLSVYGQLTFVELLIKIMIIYDNNLDQMESLRNYKAYDNSNIIKAIRDEAKSLSDTSESVADDFISVPTFRKDLQILCEDGFVKVKHAKHTTYSLSSKAPIIRLTTEDNLYIFCQKYEELAFSTNTESTDKIYDKVRLLINKEKDSIRQANFGRTDYFDQKQADLLYDFLDHPYNTKLLEFEYCDNDRIETLSFETGIIFYRKDISKYFVLGRNMNSKKICSLRLDKISNIRALNKTNKHFHSNEYYNIYQEMFLSTFEETAHKVKVLIMNYYNEPKRFEELASVRKETANFIKIQDLTDGEDPTEGFEYSENDKTFVYSYLYKDTIRGLTDFADYLAGFGLAALAIEPPELRDLMINKYSNATHHKEVQI